MGTNEATESLRHNENLADLMFGQNASNDTGYNHFVLIL